MRRLLSGRLRSWADCCGGSAAAWSRGRHAQSQIHSCVVGAKRNKIPISSSYTCVSRPHLVHTLSPAYPRVTHNTVHRTAVVWWLGKQFGVPEEVPLHALPILSSRRLKGR